MTIASIARRVLRGRALTAARKIYFVPIDPVGYIFGRKDSMVPPKRLNFAGRGNFILLGRSLLKQLIDLGGIKPSDKVLDVGCGIGRIAIPLTEFIDSGTYDGFDVFPQGIQWCRKRIEPKFPNFRFKHAEIFNAYYNPTGKFKASSYRFPYRDCHFDFVFLTSVFTHIRKLDLENYLSEVSRVLNDGGRCFITFFLLNDHTFRMMTDGVTHKNFNVKLDATSYAVDERTPEEGIAYAEDYILKLHHLNGLDIRDIVYGSWREGKVSELYQDIIISQKSGKARGFRQTMVG